MYGSAKYRKKSKNFFEQTNILNITCTMFMYRIVICNIVISTAHMEFGQTPTIRPTNTDS